jgi:hypothetical protein
MEMEERMKKAAPIVDEVADAERVAATAEAAVAQEELRTVTGDKGRGHFLDPAGSTMSGKLPGGVLVGDKLYKDFIVREMAGTEEDLLVGKGPVLPRINQVIANCLVSIGAVQGRAEIARAVQEMPTADREAVLLTLRRLSLGDAYVLPMKCPNEDCGEEDRYTIHLDKLEVRDMPNPTERRFRTTFPATEKEAGRECVWHIMTGADEEWMAGVGKKKHANDGVSLSFLARIDELGGVKLDREGNYEGAMKRVKDMPVRERNHLRQLVEEFEGGVDTTIEFQCEKCKHEWKSTIPVATPAFFFPSARRRR